MPIGQVEDLTYLFDLVVSRDRMIKGKCDLYVGAPQPKSSMCQVWYL